DDLVRVHVRARARSGLEDVDRELLVVLATRDRIRGDGDALCLVPIEEAELCVDTGGSCLDPAEPACDSHRDRLARDGEVRDSLFRLPTPERALLRGLAHGFESTPASLHLRATRGLEQLVPGAELDAGTALRLAALALEGVDCLPACVHDDVDPALEKKLLDAFGWLCRTSEETALGILD